MASTYEQRQAVGVHGENVAVEFLQAQGMEVLARNWRCRWGEIDIVARDADTVVFCEVKTRRSTAYGTPLEAVTPQKAARLRRLAGLYLAEHDVSAVLVRIDVVGVLVPTRGAAEVTYVAGVS
ncbi:MULTISPECIES: YraN family protein [Mumia]|uniref:YraN family protein n=1 Tax=Mumia TaxID=1546255 RepID=UPI0014230BE5|nr:MULTISPECIES: YraN family protein [unclassified Mumia]QMW65065.1 YraN family protein [Mumia sp. ZJ1417]